MRFYIQKKLKFFKKFTQMWKI